MSIHSYIMTTKTQIKEIRNNVVEISNILKLLADPTRLNILCTLFESSEDMCVYEIAEAIGVSQSAASHQLAKLEAYKVVESFRDGQRICYAIQDNPTTEKIEKVIGIFRS